MRFLDHVLYGEGEPVPSMEIAIAGIGQERDDHRAQRSDRDPERADRDSGRQDVGSDRGERARLSGGERAFQRADRNGDGLVQPEELNRGRRYRDAFVAHDVDGNGGLDLKEYLGLIKALRGDATAPGPPA